MDDSQRSGARNLIIGIVVLLLVVVGGVVAVQGCHEPNSMEERIDPDDQLPGTIEGTGSLVLPDAAPLLAA